MHVKAYILKTTIKKLQIKNILASWVTRKRIFVF